MTKTVGLSKLFAKFRHSSDFLLCLFITVDLTQYFALIPILI